MDLKDKTKTETQDKIDKEKGGIWIDVHSDLVAGIKAFSQCLTLCDVMGDGDYRLICGDSNCKLKVFKGQILQSETKLQFTPVSILGFYSQDSNNKNLSPYLAVAGGSYIFIYKNLKGTFKFLVPNLDPSQKEIQIWSELKDNKIDNKEAFSKLEELVKSKTELSTRSLELLSLTSEVARGNYIEERKNNPIVIANFITCMTTLKKNNPDDPLSVSELIVGTESGYIYVVEHSGSKIINKFKLNHIPYQVSTLGAYDVDYRIHIAARNNCIYTIKNGEIQKSFIQVQAKILSILRSDRSIIVATIDSHLHSYHPQGKKNFSIKMPTQISCLELMDCKKSKNFKGILVALKNAEIRLYNDKILLNVLKLSEPIFGLKFGKYGREDESLIIITESGSLLIKVLQRNVNLDTLTVPKKAVGDQDTPLNIPKKTKLFVDLLEREKDVASTMHQIFQNDLCKLRYKTLSTYVKMLKIGNAPQNYNSVSKIKLTSNLQGLGPNFRLNLSIDNTGDEPIIGCDLLIEYDKQIHYFQKETIQLGIIMPNVPITHSLAFRNISDTGTSGILKIIIIDKANNVPMITSSLKVPISEMELA